MNFLTEYWPWWLGAGALGGVSIGFWWVMGRPLGVSGSWTRVVSLREEAAAAAAEAEYADDEAAFEAALEQATLEEFGPDAGAELELSEDLPKGEGQTFRVPWTEHLTLLVAIAVGGFLSALASGSFELSASLGKDFERLLGSGWVAVAALFIGGALVGFGTRMSGGCTTGHGLSGCGSGRPASFAGTAAFFGVAVATSFLIEFLGS